MLQLNQSTIVIDLDAVDFYEVINILAQRLFEQGFVTSEYGEQACLREEVHPTGLPTQPFCIAFPHADCDGVIESALAVGILKNPVNFKNMADPDEDLSVNLVIMLANADPSEQIQTLRSLATLFGDAEKLVELRSQTTPEDTVIWLKHELCLE